jgi:hypothetical protein
MSGLPTFYWLLAIVLVAVMFFGSWMVVRVMRARRPLPGIQEDEDERP